jgi:hypothetical protein
MPQKVRFNFATAESVIVFETPITLAAKWCGKDGEKNLRGLAGILGGLEKVHGLADSDMYWPAVLPLVLFARDTQELSAGADTDALVSKLYDMLEGYHALSTHHLVVPNPDDTYQQIIGLLEVAYKHVNAVIEGIVKTCWTRSSQRFGVLPAAGLKGGNVAKNKKYVTGNWPDTIVFNSTEANFVLANKLYVDDVQLLTLVLAVSERWQESSTGGVLDAKALINDLLARARGRDIPIAKNFLDQETLRAHKFLDSLAANARNKCPNFPSYDVGILAGMIECYLDDLQAGLGLLPSRNRSEAHRGTGLCTHQHVAIGHVSSQWNSVSTRTRNRVPSLRWQAPQASQVLTRCNAQQLALILKPGHLRKSTFKANSSYPRSSAFSLNSIRARRLGLTFMRKLV